MTKIIKIPLEGGFDKKSSPEAVGVGLTNIENLQNLNSGALTQREGYGTATEIGGGSNDKLILDIEYWLKDTTLWWLAYDRILGQINRLSEDFTTATSLNTIHQTTATQTVGSGNNLIVEAHEWTGTEPTTYYFKITSDATPDVFQISTDDTTYANAQNVVTSSTTVTGASGLKAYWGSTTSSALNDKWEVTVYPLPKRIGIANWGNAVRFAYGLYHNPTIYQYIDRKFFNDGTDFMYTPTAGYDYDIAYPILPSTWDYEPLDAGSGLKGTLASGGNLTQPRDYYYRITAIFDGSQETTLPDDYFGPLSTDASNRSCLLKLKIDTLNYNKRITAINLYRADTTGGTPDKSSYRLISTIPFTETQTSWINSSQGYLGRKIYAYGLNWSPASLLPASGCIISATGTPGSGSPSGTQYSIPFVNGAYAKFLWLANEFNDISGVGGTDYWNTATARLYYWLNGGNILNDTESFSIPDNQNGNTFEANAMTSAGGSAVDRTLAVHYEGGDWYGGSMQGSGSVTIEIFAKLINQDNNATINTSTGEATHKIMKIYETGNNNFGGGSGSSWGSSGSTLYSDAQWNIGTADNLRFTYTSTMSTTGDADENPNQQAYANSMTTNMRLRTTYTTDDNAYSHQSGFAIVNNSINTGEGVGKIVKVNGADFTITQNQGDLFLTSGNQGWDEGTSTSGNLIGGADVQWEDNGDDGTLSATEKRVIFTDVGEIEGSYHSFAGVDSLKTRFKYSTSAGGRQYVGNVVIEDKLGQQEKYDDMVLFSELNQPDVIPISNFIKLNDQQGGAITGIKGLFSDIVVFAERGIFRINVPSEDPLSWSMVEAEKNLGCNQPNSIIEYRGGIFFAGTDNLWYISPNFEFIPLAEPWKDDYQTALASTTEIDDTQIGVDVKAERLVCKIGTEKDILYLMDLRAFANKKILWFKNSPAETSANEGEIHSLTIKNDNTFYLLNKMTGSNSTKIRPITGGHGNNTPLLKTGVIFFRSLTDNDNAFIRRINFNMYSNVSVTNRTFEVKCFIDHSSEDSDYLGFEKIVTKTLIMTEDTQTGTDNYYSVRIGRRAKSLQLQLKESAIFGDEEPSPLKIKGIEIEID